jgi:hypothetical protein
MKKTAILLIVAIALALGATSRASTKTIEKPELPEIFVPKQEIQAMDKTDQIPKITRETHRTFLPTTYGDANKIRFSNGIILDLQVLGKAGEPDLPDELKIEYRDDESGYYIVQFSGPVHQEQKAWLEASGATIHFCIPRYGYVCTINNKALVDQIRANVSVNWVGTYQPAYKISRLFDRVGQEHETIMLLFNDSDINEVLQQVKTITRNSEFTTIDNGINKLIQGVVNKNDIKKLAQLKEVYWIGPHIQPELHNNNVQWIVQSGDNAGFARPIWAHGINGENEIVSNTDSGINTSHVMHRHGSPAFIGWGHNPA